MNNSIIKEKLAEIIESVQFTIVAVNDIYVELEVYQEKCDTLVSIATILDRLDF